MAGPATPGAATPRPGPPGWATLRTAAPEPATEVPTTVAKGTGVIAVKKGGKAMVATVARVADKPIDPSSATRTDSPPKDPGAAAPTTKPAAAPRFYGEEPPKDNTHPSAAQQVPLPHRQ